MSEEVVSWVALSMAGCVCLGLLIHAVRFKFGLLRESKKLGGIFEEVRSSKFAEVMLSFLDTGTSYMNDMILN